MASMRRRCELLASSIIGSSVISSVWERKFRTFFGMSITGTVVLWQKLLISLAGQHVPFSFIHLLMALYFLKIYPLEEVAAATFKVTEKTYRKWIWILIERIRRLDLIDFDDRYENWTHRSACCTLDGTDCKIDEHHPFNKAYFSHKLNHAGLRYEIAMALGTSKILWWNGGVPCGAHPDLVLAQSGFTKMLDEDEQALADKGYRGCRQFSTPFGDPQTQYARTFNRQHKRIMARSETVNKRIKHFAVLRSWRHKSDELHCKCFGAIMQITQIMLSEQPSMDLWL
uniref:DDE Tnp4 domain-containing protein n=1 Tax=Spongospora subterranea TaxID=70186 RepID=A0A0H5QZD6_9EUKA|eukprot:CRZ00924.1 hypothetical protein [Spongospora subterranea]